jgi:hypothetical protein
MSSRGDKNTVEDPEASFNNAEDQEAAGLFSSWPIVAGIYVLQRDGHTRINFLAWCRSLPHAKAVICAK